MFHFDGSYYAAVAKDKQLGAFLVRVMKVAHITSHCHRNEVLYCKEQQGKVILSDFKAGLVAPYEVVITFPLLSP
jgi:hypothetical protein